jgi:hypothetical protein
MSACSIFNNFHKPVDKRSLILIAKDIASDKYKAPVEKIRKLLQQGKTGEAQELKKQLLAFTPSGVFKNRRVKDDVEMYNNFIHLDFDKLTDEQIANAKIILAKDPYTFAFFISPSGHGLKVFVEVTSGIEDHTTAYMQVQAHYEKLTGLKADPSCKDITRLCFMSYDPQLYKNLDNKKFVVKGQKSQIGQRSQRSQIERHMEEELEREDPSVRCHPELVAGSTSKMLKQVQHDSGGNPNPLTSKPLNPSTSQPSKPSQPSQLSPSLQEEIFNPQVQFTNRIKTYQEGSRNAYIYQLAINCSNAGLAEQTTIDLASKNYDLPYKEIQQTVKSAYKAVSYELRASSGEQQALSSELRAASGEALTPNPLNLSTSQLSQSRTSGTSLRSASKLSPEEDDAPQESMPTLPGDIFDKLPDFLKRITCVARNKEERDILLLGSLTTLSVALHKLVGRYGDNPVNANLYLFISAAASAGKGILNHCRKLVLPIHKRLKEQTKVLRQLYRAQMMEYKINKNRDASAEEPEKPPIKMLIIPGNISSTGFSQVLNDSHQRGIIFETEGDTLTATFKTDYGDFSAALRNAYQHEPIAYFRRTEQEHVEIERPCLSVLLSGTPKQIQELIPSAENGLFSRFMFYVMNRKYEWKNMLAYITDKGLDLHFENLGKEFFDFYERIEVLPDMNFIVTEEQEQRFNAFFEAIQNLYITIQQEDIISSVRRLALSAYRVMMIFSALRLMETGEETRRVVCEDIDLENTLKIVSVLAKHSSHVFTQVAGEAQKPRPKNRMEMFFDVLPEEFNRGAYLEAAQKLNIPDNTAQRYVRKFQKAGLIFSPVHNQHRKISVRI